MAFSQLNGVLYAFFFLKVFSFSLVLKTLNEMVKCIVFPYRKDDFSFTVFIKMKCALGTCLRKASSSGIPIIASAKEGYSE